jgi:hypothetical protein
MASCVFFHRQDILVACISVSKTRAYGTIRTGRSTGLQENFPTGIRGELLTESINLVLLDLFSSA